MAWLVAGAWIVPTASGQGARLSLQAAWPGEKGALRAASGVTVEVLLRGKSVAKLQTDMIGRCHVPIATAGEVHLIRLSRSDLASETLEVTYNAAGGYFRVGLRGGSGPPEKLAPGVYRSVTLPRGGAPPPAPSKGKWRIELGLVESGKKDAQGNWIPVAGASVFIRQAGRVVTSGLTDRKGIYLSVPLPPGKYTVDATCPGFKTLLLDLEVVDRDVRRGAGLVRLPAGAPPVRTNLTVHVRPFEPAMRGQPLSGAEVIVSQSGRLAAGGFTDAKGEFRTPIMTGQYLVNVSKPGYKTDVGKTTVRAGGMGHWVYLRKDPTAVAPKIVVVTVLVRASPHLAPVSGAFVERLDATGRVDGKVGTNAQGQCQFRNTVGKTIKLRVNRRGYATSTVTLTVPPRDVTRLVILLPSAP
jgi:hypothetical protein